MHWEKQLFDTAAETHKYRKSSGISEQKKKMIKILILDMNTRYLDLFICIKNPELLPSTRMNETKKKISRKNVCVLKKSTHFCAFRRP